MTLSLYNTLTRSLEPFQPLDPPRVRVYACGPTVYDFPHIGNFRSFLAYDLLHRYLEWRGYQVRLVVNLTDVDDRTIEAAVKRGVTLKEHTEPFAEAFLADARTLGILQADSHPRATDYVERMVTFVQGLVEKGLAYRTDDGSVYFSIAAFPSYGKLSRVDPETLRAGARVQVDDDKDDVRDFALWKSAKPQDEAASAAWDSPWGRGRPGWHLECSVMSIAELGDTIDIHMGGEDLIFPHHEDEIAQSEGATGKPFARTWLHVKHLLVEGRKMSKSLGNFIVVRELLDSGHEPSSIRHLLLSAHYRSELNFTIEGLQASKRAVQRLLDFESRLEECPGADDAPACGLVELAQRAVDDFRAAMDDDLNSSNGLAALFTLVGQGNSALDRAKTISTADRAAARDALASIDKVLGLVEVARTSRALDLETIAWVDRMVEERKAARAAKDFARGDAIRKELAEKGIVLEDSAQGTRWKVVRRGGGDGQPG
ncbi:MAG: cysteine--tRNA ligase [Gemmatimonadetes bacterium]|nr:cysteine--tRNA ligase [Gemmatimonadota bacterium]